MYKAFGLLKYKSLIIGLISAQGLDIGVTRMTNYLETDGIISSDGSILTGTPTDFGLTLADSSIQGASNGYELSHHLQPYKLVLADETTVVGNVYPAGFATTSTDIVSTRSLNLPSVA